MASGVSSKPNFFIFLDEDFTLINQHDRSVFARIDREELRLMDQHPTESRLRAFGACFIQKAVKNLETLVQRVRQAAVVSIVLYGNIVWRASSAILKETVFAKASFKDRITDATVHSKEASELCSKKYGFSLQKGNAPQNGRKIDFYLRENFEKVDSFVIIGNQDYEISARYPERFVQTHCEKMLSLDDIALAEWILTEHPFSKEQFPLESYVEKNVEKQEELREENKRKFEAASKRAQAALSPLFPEGLNCLQAHDEVLKQHWLETREREAAHNACVVS